jgi:hypothetical protein
MSVSVPIALPKAASAMMTPAHGVIPASAWGARSAASCT